MRVAPCAQGELLDAIVGEIDATADAALGAIVSDVPHYRALSAQELEEVRTMTIAGSVAFVGLWREGRLAHRHELQAFREHGAARAAAGRPLAIVLRAYRAAGLAGFRAAIGSRADAFGVHEVANGAALLMAFVDQLCDSVTEGYVEASEQLSAPSRRAARDLLEGLLSGHLAGGADAEARAAGIGLTLPRHPRLLMVTGSVLPTAVRAALTGDPDARLPAVPTRGRVVALVEADDGTGLRAAVAAGRLRAVAVDTAGLDELPAALRICHDVLTLAERGLAPSEPLIGDPEARLLSATARMLATHADQLRAAIAPLDERQHAHLLDALWAYVQTGNAVSAASLLGLHPQTMRYRLRRVRALTGRSLENSWDRFALEAALRAHLVTAAEPARV